MPVSASTPVELVNNAYAKFNERIDAARKKLDRPLTLAEKILIAHLDDPDADFEAHAPGIWLSDSGRRKLIAVYERRKQEEHRHPALEYSLSWARMMELETRLLEKEWSGEPGLFARLRIH